MGNTAQARGGGRLERTLDAPGRDTARVTAGRILVVDDEQRILEFVSRGLRAEGYAVDAVDDAQRGLEAALARSYELIILDLLMPGLPGTVVLDRILQRRPGQPVIVLSCLTDSTSKVHCLGLGAADYVAKPFCFDELLLRVKARIRSARQSPDMLQIGRLKLDLVRRWVEAGGRRVALTEREFLLLKELMQRPGETLSKDHLLSSVWGYRFDPGSNVVDVYIRRLRAKAGADAVITVRGEGYRINDA